MPTPAQPPSILVLNSGSSSLKAALFVPAPGSERAILEASATGIGQTQGKLSIQDFREDPAGQPLAQPTDTHNYQSQTEALAKIAEALHQHAGYPPSAIGHRIVHGGVHLTTHQEITPEVLTQLEQALHFAPLHIPGSLALIHAAQQLYPGTRQFACFDTAFHQTLPEQAWRLPIPGEWSDRGVRRYGFHGLSYESIVAQLQAERALPERLVVAHLGSGSSLAAILRGKSVDTSMGFTPAGGVPMATRTGDLDPGVLIYLMRSGGLGLDEVEALVNHHGGLTALSGGISDMQQLEAAAAAAGTPAGQQAALAIAVFANAVASTIAAYLVPLCGLDMLVFTGGIGEHSASFRAAVIERLQPLGMRLDAAANQAAATTLSSTQSRVLIRLLPAQEDLQIARHVRAMLG
ncbi:MAG TPA: acetate/propionate family kinase [Acidobacteriaceae bacterium]